MKKSYLLSKKDSTYVLIELILEDINLFELSEENIKKFEKNLEIELLNLQSIKWGESFLSITVLSPIDIGPSYTQIEKLLELAIKYFNIN